MSDDDECKSSDPSSPLSGKSLIKAVGKFFYEDDDFAAVFERFVEENAHVIDEEEISKTGTMKVEYTEVYEQFQQLFESHIEGHITEKLNSSVSEFYKALEESVEKDPDGEDAIFGQIMLATADFDVFMIMMREAAVQNAGRK